MREEIWKQVKGYGGLYQVSNLGRVKSLHVYGGKERILKPRPTNKRGALAVVLYKDGKPESVKVHKLVAETYLSNINREEGYYICHKNGDCTDNRLINLRFDSQTENFIDEFRNGTSYLKNGLTASDVFQIRMLYQHKIYSHSELAKIYDSYNSDIHKIIRRETFDFINDDGTISDSTTGFDIHSRVEQLTFSSGKIDSGKHHGNKNVLSKWFGKVGA